jgi:hypothetical protein
MKKSKPLGQVKVSYLLVVVLMAWHITSPDTLNGRLDLIALILNLLGF